MTKNTIKDQLNQVGILNVYPLVQLNDEQIKEYLEKPPNGINPILWEQAKRNNPNPSKLIPVPIVGFQGKSFFLSFFISSNLNDFRVKQAFQTARARESRTEIVSIQDKGRHRVDKH